MIKVLVVIFLLLLVLNGYFRYRVTKAYNALRRADVNISAKDVLDGNSLEQHVIPKYKEHEKQIRDYVRYLKIGFSMTSVVLIFIIILGIYMFRSY